jgi:hydroxyacylglutathione hydrolase
VGYDNCIGYLNGGFDSWKNSGKKISTIKSITAEELAQKLKLSPLHVFDVRRPAEYEAKYLQDATNNPLDFIKDWAGNFDKSKEYYIHCAGGYRSMIASSILQAKGFDNLTDVTGGFSAFEKTGDFIIKSAC